VHAEWLSVPFANDRIPAAVARDLLQFRRKKGLFRRSY
jgi:hypothetical protein